MPDKEYYIILNVGLGVKNIVKVRKIDNNLSKKYIGVAIVHPWQNMNFWQVTGVRKNINNYELLMVDKKYLFETLNDALNYLEEEL